MAHDYGYPSWRKKADSAMKSVSFPTMTTGSFLKRRVAGLEEKVDGGQFIDKEGRGAGETWAIRFTRSPAQRHRDRPGKTGFVTQIDPVHNTVVWAHEADLEQNEMTVTRLNLMKYDSIVPGMEALTKIRYKDGGTLSNLYPEGADLRIRFYAPAKSIVLGQSAVFYDGPT